MHLAAIALLFSAAAATAPYPVPRIDENQLPVPEHSIGDACGSLKYQEEIAQCNRSEEIERRYVRDTWGSLSIEEQKEAAALALAKDFHYGKFYSDLANYIEDKLRRRQSID